MDESSGLLNRRTSNRTQGSNPCISESSFHDSLFARDFSLEYILSDHSKLYFVFGRKVIAEALSVARNLSQYRQGEDYCLQH